jgi:hypothetical protein
MLFVLTLTLLAVAGAACSGTVERSWSEEVDIGSGTTMNIGRYSKFVESHSLSGDVYSVSDSESTITFNGEYAELPTWHEPLVPILLYRDENSQWVIVATADNCEIWDRRGKPSNGYWEFRLRGTSWIESALSPTSDGRKTNLFFHYAPPLPARALTIEMKDKALVGKNFADRWLKIDGAYESKCKY